MHSTDEAVDLLYPCYSLGIAENVDGARMAAAGRHDQSFPVDVENNALIIPRPGIRLPTIVVFLFVLKGESFLVIRDPFNLPRNQSLVRQE